MGVTCILGVDDNRVLKDFVRAHEELLAPPKISVAYSYPDFAHDGKRIRDFYPERRILARIQKLMPHAVYSRLAAKRLQSREATDKALRSFFRKHGVDVILAEFGPTGANICRVARDLGIPLIVHFHGHDAHRATVVQKHAASYREMFDYAFAIVSVSRFMTDTLVGLGAARSRIVYNPYGPRDRFFANEPDYSQTVLSVGRFTDIKANYLTLEAFRRALDSCPDAKLVLVGDGELLETCRTLSKRWRIGGSVVFRGAIPHAEVTSAYSRACCFAQHSVTPSYGDAEGTPVAILEAGAAGLPVVSTRHAGIPDAVLDGETGYVVDELDVDAMAERLVALLSDSALCRTMGARAREHIRNSYSMTRHISRLQQTIDAARSNGTLPEDMS
jgi:glycosyltransferase involved in cell wall biosynthesis